MSAGRMDVLVVREQGDRSFFTRVGVAFPTKGGGYSLLLDALPTNGKLLLMPAKEKGGGGQRGDAYEGDDDVPY